MAVHIRTGITGISVERAIREKLSRISPSGKGRQATVAAPPSAPAPAPAPRPTPAPPDPARQRAERIAGLFAVTSLGAAALARIATEQRAEATAPPLSDRARDLLTRTPAGRAALDVRRGRA